MAAVFTVRTPAGPAHRNAGDVAEWVTDHWLDRHPRGTDMDKLSSRLDSVLTAEVTAPGVADGVGLELVLTAALGRAIARTVGLGTLSVFVDGEGVAPYAARLGCTLDRSLSSADMLAAVAPSTVADVRDAWVSYRSTVAGTTPPDGYLLALHARRGTDVIYLDWWYDTRSFERHTIEEFAEQLPLALIEVTSN